MPSKLSVNTTRHGLSLVSITTTNCPAAMPPLLALRSKYQDSAGLVDHEVEQVSPLGQLTQLVVQVADEHWPVSTASTAL